LTELQAELEAYGACDPVKVEEKRRAVMLGREAALRHTGNVYCLTRHFSPPNAGITHGEADEMADNYSILMSHFTRQHNVDPQDIRTYLGVGIDYEELC
jgi:hypothetical protein